MQFCQSTQTNFLVAYTILYWLLGGLYLLNNFVHSEFLRPFKAAPFLVLLYVLMPHWRNKNVLMVMAGVIAGAAGDLILEYGG
jgi:hypothetical protein